MTDPGAGWTDDRVERLKRLWAEGHSASQIAAELGGGVTRNAVIGKVHRLGLSGRAKAPSAATQRPRRPARPVEQAGIPAAEPAQPRVTAASAPSARVIPLHQETASAPQPVVNEDIAAPVSERVTIMELRDSMCRWPLGDPTTAEFRFCGARSITGLPYCTFHARIAYQPATERKRIRA